jgi:hypothetical protein
VPETVAIEVDVEGEVEEASGWGFDSLRTWFEIRGLRFVVLWWRASGCRR